MESSLVVVHLHRRGNELSEPTKGFYYMVILVLTLLTSVEVMGFLAQSHSQGTKAIRGIELTLSSLREEKATLESQIAVIDSTLEGLPKKYVTKRINERKASGYDQKQARLLEINQELKVLEQRQIEEKLRAGPVIAVSELMQINGDQAVTLLILVLVLVMEPLSLGLAVAVSAAWKPDEAPPVANSQLALLRSYLKTYGITRETLAEITNRRNVATVEKWLTGESPIPSDVFAILQRTYGVKGPGEALEWSEAY